MLSGIAKRIHLIFRLLRDKRVNVILKVLFLVPFILSLVIGIPNVVPLLGFLDNLLLFIVLAFFFVTLIPSKIVHEHKVAVGLSDLSVNEQTTPGLNQFPLESGEIEQYRHPEEVNQLIKTFVVIVIGLLFTGSLLGWVLFFVGVLAFIGTRIRHALLMGNAVKVTPTHFPELYALQQECARTFPYVKYSLFVIQNPTLNAYAFGLSAPYTVVLHSALVDALDREELKAVIAHEVGHIAFGHTLVASLLGGLLEVPGTPLLSGLFWLIFLRWSRLAEYSADRIALIASGRLDKTVSALLRIASGRISTEVKVEEFLKQADELKADMFGRIASALSSHPLMVDRVRELVAFARAMNLEKVG